MTRIAKRSLPLLAALFVAVAIGSAHAGSAPNGVSPNGISPNGVSPNGVSPNGTEMSPGAQVKKIELPNGLSIVVR